MNLLETMTGLKRGTVVELLRTGEILVELAGGEPQRMLCDFLQTSNGPGPVLKQGDAVLVWPSPSLEQKGCVLGKVGGYSKPDAHKVVIEAERELVLKCGQGSVTMNQEGKILIKGTDVVSNAKRKNRIRGGSVQIN